MSDTRSLHPEANAGKDYTNFEKFFSIHAFGAESDGIATFIRRALSFVKALNTPFLNKWFTIKPKSTAILRKEVKTMVIVICAIDRIVTFFTMSRPMAVYPRDR